MKMLIALIQPEKLDSVKHDLSEAGLANMTVLPALGAGTQRGYKYLFSDLLESHLLHKTMIIMALKDSLVNTAVETIKKTAWSGKIGDGKIFIISLENVIRIRTGEEGEAAVS